jgi:hypothetical protein
VVTNGAVRNKLMAQQKIKSTQLLQRMQKKISSHPQDPIKSNRRLGHS